MQVDAMQTLEQQITERWPHWFRGHRRLLAQSLLRSLGRWSGLERAYDFLGAHAHLHGFDFVAAALEHLGLRYSVDQVERRRIPASGRLLIVANHPCGAPDALALLDFVGGVRRDVKIVANDLLMQIEPLRDLLLPVRILGGQTRADGLAAIEHALAQEQCVIVFPAGEVSRLGARGVSDGRWRRGFLRFARNTQAPVLPVRVEARNSAFFYGASALFKPVGTALLTREMFTHGARRIGLRVGEAMRIDPDEDNDAVLRKVRQALYAIGKRREAQPVGPQPLVAAVAPGVLAQAIDSLQVLGGTADGKRICAGRLCADSPVLHEIGRLRELTFRAVGEGTGKPIDVDAFDLHYEHIVVWDAPAQRIAGAYRVARGASVLAEQGLRGLYTASLFDYADAALPRIAEGMELGRSFVVPDYWGSRSIDYLWQGIGAYLRRHPQVRWLFGAVSMSGQLPLAARERIVAHYRHYYGVADSPVRSRRPFHRLPLASDGDGLDVDAAFVLLKRELDALGVTLPMLYKQYTELCEPGGVRFLDFGVDPDFSDSVDGLIEVDLHAMRPKKRARYLQPRKEQVNA